jgi:hypothetical protein
LLERVHLNSNELNNGGRFDSQKATTKKAAARACVDREQSVRG